MKKLLAYLCIFALVHNSILLPVTVSLAGIKTAALQKKEQILRFWHCAIAPKKYSCLPEEISRTRQWFAGISLATLAIILAAVGLKVRKDKLAQVKIKQEEEARFMEVVSEYKKINGQITEAGRTRSLAVIATVSKLQKERERLENQMQAFPKLYERWLRNR